MKVSILFFVASASAQYLYRSPPLIGKRGISPEKLLLPRQAECSLGQVTCSFGGCCPSGTTCETVNNSPGCCPVGSNCGGSSSSATPSQASNQNVACATGTYLCPVVSSGCCPVGTLCVQDSSGNISCCASGETCAGTTLGLSQGGTTATGASQQVSTTQKASASNTTPQTSATPSQSAGVQGSCQSGLVACTDGSGGCCPSGTQCIVDSQGVPGCSVSCSSADISCPGGGCCSAGLQCDASRPGFCTSPGSNSSVALTVAASGTVNRYTGKATASVIGGGGFDFGPTTPVSSSLAKPAALPQVALLVPSVIMGLIVLGAFMAL